MNNPKQEQELTLIKMNTALVMAGGRSERMRKSNGPTIKPLVSVAGVPLLERNLQALIRFGIEDIHVVIPAQGEPELMEWVSSRAVRLIRAAGARLEIHEETIPRGNIGGCGDLHGKARDLLVVFADNLTTLDLRALLRDHDQGGAALTLAVHEEPFRMSFGEVRTEGDQVTGYLFANKLVVRFVLVDGLDHIVAVQARLGNRVIGCVTGSVGIPNHIQPMAAPAFTVTR